MHVVQPLCTSQFVSHDDPASYFLFFKSCMHRKHVSASRSGECLMRTCSRLVIPPTERIEGAGRPLLLP